MKLIIPLILASLILISCIDNKVIDKKSIQEQLTEEQLSEEAKEVVKEAKEQTKREYVPERETLRKLRSDFDFDSLTRENCNSIIKSKILEISKQQAKLERLENDLDNKERIVRELKQQFNNPDPDLSAEDLRDLRDDINLADRKVDELREEVKDETRVYENLKFTLDEIEYDCKRLR